MELAALILSVMAFSCGVAALAVSCVCAGMAKAKEAPPQDPPAEEPEDREEARRSKEIDEGFDALMRFSVNGHDGFDAGGMTL